MLRPEARKLREKRENGQDFREKQIGRPVGDFDSKRLQYLKMLNDNKIKQPKQQTLEYYGIDKQGDKYVLYT